MTRSGWDLSEEAYDMNFGVLMAEFNSNMEIERIKLVKKDRNSRKRIQIIIDRISLQIVRSAFGVKKLSLIL